MKLFRMTTITSYMRNKLLFGIESADSDVFDFYRMCKYYPDDVKKMWEIFASKEMDKLQFLKSQVLQMYKLNIDIYNFLMKN